MWRALQFTVHFSCIPTLDPHNTQMVHIIKYRSKVKMKDMIALKISIIFEKSLQFSIFSHPFWNPFFTLEEPHAAGKHTPLQKASQV